MYSDDLKARAIHLYNKFQSLRYVSKLLFIGKSTIHRWITNTTTNVIKDNYEYLYDFIKESIHSNKFITLHKLREAIYN